MAKTIIKEVCIMILLLIAIVLIFGVLFYEYIPLSKTIPNKVTYQIPEEIANEIAGAKVEESSPVNVIYQIDESELKMYQRTNNYKAGKVNPFASVAGDTTGTNETSSGNSNTNSSTNNSGTSSSNNNSTSSSTNSNSTGTYFNNTGTK